MKMVVVFAMSLLLSGAALAEEAKSAAPQEKNAVAEVTKKVRKKKVEMCGECGKPESECECHGHKKTSEKKEEKTSK